MSLKAAFVTLLTKTSYLAGALVTLSPSIPLVVMVTPEFPQEGRDVLKKRGIDMINVQSLQPEDGVHSLAAADERFRDTWTKLRAFELVQFEDMLVKENIDDLMEVTLPPGGIAAVHVCACNPRKFPHYPSDWIPENCAFSAVSGPMGASPSPTDHPRPYGQLNSGTVVLEPSTELAKSLYHVLATDARVPTWSFPDQDLLTAVFHGKWTALPWYYNALRTLRTIHAPVWDDKVARCQGSPEEFGVVNSWWWAQYDKVCAKLQAEDVEGWKLVTSTVAS
ncbi:nucleotide-diphospho-sugar transferase [Mycena alexandri]|uniref:Nucleotide-diphospho-sugar transferase n=1 Tax=Mycena alexandri TaxID=1745969 RepID=A0AAD6T3C6_9AGAR|nr:nucleotide-diphospho-sugar transferase [Mycena alexandri]